MLRGGDNFSYLGKNKWILVTNTRLFCFTNFFVFKTQIYILMDNFCTCFEKTINKYLDLYSDNSDFVDQLIEKILKELDQNFVFAD